MLVLVELLVLAAPLYPTPFQFSAILLEKAEQKSLQMGRN